MKLSGTFNRLSCVTISLQRKRVGTLNMYFVFTRPIAISLVIVFMVCSVDLCNIG